MGITFGDSGQWISRGEGGVTRGTGGTEGEEHMGG